MNYPKQSDYEYDAKSIVSSVFDHFANYIEELNEDHESETEKLQERIEELEARIEELTN